MKLQIMHVKAYLLFMFFSLSFFTIFAQTKNDDPKLLQGKWILENAFSISGTNDTIHFNVNNPDFDIYSEMEIKQETLTITHKGNTLEGKYVIDETNRSFDFPLKQFRVSWEIIDNKLYLQQIVTDKSDESKMIFVSLIYK